MRGTPSMTCAPPMTPNTLRARLTFSFKGDTHDLDTAIDLDACVAEEGETPNFHLILARAAGIDTYSYLYEVLESHDIEFIEPEGLAVACCREGRFDWFAFLALREEARELAVVAPLAETFLGVTDLDNRADLKAALLAAYRAGKRQ